MQYPFPEIVKSQFHIYHIFLQKLDKLVQSAMHYMQLQVRLDMILYRI